MMRGHIERYRSEGIVRDDELDFVAPTSAPTLEGSGRRQGGHHDLAVEAERFEVSQRLVIAQGYTSAMGSHDQNVQSRSESARQGPSDHLAHGAEGEKGGGVVRRPPLRAC
jgi:hypothetical protein